MREFTETFIFPIIPDEFFTRGGITKVEYLERISTHSDAATFDEKQFFKGVYKKRCVTCFSRLFERYLYI